ncbi:MAG: DUF6151 family protein [Gammaproteobacteria bacterium]
MNIPIRCTCGQLQGYIESGHVAARALCYCRDCQAYARFLDGGTILDAQGGTEVVATLPKAVHFTQGEAQLACMSLKPKGLYRWYAKCCRTPIGNTPRPQKVAYAGMVRACLAATDEELKQALGDVRVPVNTESARGPVKSNGLRFVAAGLKISRMVLGARLSGAYKQNPFYKGDTNVPVREPEVLDPEARARAYA